MGREARAKTARWNAGESVPRGNPEPFQPVATVISREKYLDATTQGKALRAKFSDREYAMDAQGQLRRLQPAPANIATMTFQQPSEI